MAGSQLLLDRYRVLSEIGAGGFGTVEHAYDTRLRRDVAIKVIPLSEADQAKAHLAALENEIAPTAVIEAAPTAVDLPGLDEARAAAQLSDPSIVTVYDFEIHDGVAYIIMEYIEGVTLTELMEDQGDDITLDEIAAIFTAVSTALTKAHQAGVLHLDVKPDNVLIDSSGAVKVTDFGLATLVDSSGTGTTGGGTVGYMPLEQMRREPLDGRTDEWALAAMTYAMLTGANPYEVSGGLSAAEKAIETTTLDPPSRYWEPLGPEFDAVIDRALAPDIDDRYRTVKAFASALKGFLGSPRAGKTQLAAYMNDEESIEPGPIAEPAEPLAPLVDRIGEAGATLILRGVAVLGVVMITATALVNASSGVIGTIGGLFGATAADGYASMGLAGAAPWLFWTLVALSGVLAAVRPEIGVGIAWVLFSLVWLINGQWIFGLIMLAATALWWWLAGRHGPGEAVIGALEPLVGSIGFGALAPVVAGAVLRTPRALVCVLWNIVVALAFAGLGSTELMGWNVFLNITAVPRPVIDGAIACALRPETWCVALSWLLATLVFSLSADRGGHRLSVAGAFIAAALLIAGVCCGAWFSSYGLSALPSVFPFIGALIPGVLGIVFAVLGVPEKSREDASEASSASE